MEKVGCCHLEEVDVKVLVGDPCLRHSESGLEEAEVLDSFGAAVPCDLVVVNLQDLFQPEEKRRQRV